jgi:hypothetical protein
MCQEYRVSRCGHPARKAAADNDARYAKLGAMAHHKRKRPKHRRSGCLLCKPHKLTTNVKGERRRSRQASLEHERAADEEAEAIADQIKSGAADHKKDDTKALERLGIVVGVCSKNALRPIRLPNPGHR